VERACFERRSAHPPARATSTELTGRVFTSGSRVGFAPHVSARHGAQGDSGPHAVEIERFARQIAMRLRPRAQPLLMQELVLIAAPRLLGVLRGALRESLRHLVGREGPRDLTSAVLPPIAQVAFGLPEAITPAAAAPG
jgi:protein required for attachment to host cells